MTGTEARWLCTGRTSGSGGGGQCHGEHPRDRDLGVTAASRGKLGAVGRGAVPGVSPIVLICIGFSARTLNLRQNRYKRIQCHHRIKR
jgi:hypothetical protein